jgi:hypothetical protein
MVGARYALYFSLFPNRLLYPLTPRGFHTRVLNIRTIPNSRCTRDGKALLLEIRWRSVKVDVEVCIASECRHRRKMNVLVPMMHRR